MKLLHPEWHNGNRATGPILNGLFTGFHKDFVNGTPFGLGRSVDNCPSNIGWLEHFGARRSAIEGKTYSRGECGRPSCYVLILAVYLRRYHTNGFNVCVRPITRSLKQLYSS